jgi:hypothetical protein
MVVGRLIAGAAAVASAPDIRQDDWGRTRVR